MWQCVLRKDCQLKPNRILPNRKGINRVNWEKHRSALISRFDLLSVGTATKSSSLFQTCLMYQTKLSQYKEKKGIHCFSTTFISFISTMQHTSTDSQFPCERLTRQGLNWLTKRAKTTREDSKLQWSDEWFLMMELKRWSGVKWQMNFRRTEIGTKKDGI